jgi:hypothetical protein
LTTFAQIYRLFPEQQAQIDRLLTRDPDFQEMCEDYLEVDSLLDSAREAPNASEPFKEYCRTLLGELEDEIRETLERDTLER